jgi:hypothetical protein
MIGLPFWLSRRVQRSKTTGHDVYCIRARSSSVPNAQELLDLMFIIGTIHRSNSVRVERSTDWPSFKTSEARSVLCDFIRVV